MTKKEYLFQLQLIEIEINKKHIELKDMDRQRSSLRAEYIKQNYKFWSATKVLITYPEYVVVMKRKEVVLPATTIEVYADHYELARDHDVVNLWVTILPDGSRGKKYEIERRPHTITIIE